MPRRKKKNRAPRISLPASELERMIVAPLRGRSRCTMLKGVAFVYVGSFGAQPVPRTIPSLVSDACRREFVTAFGAVRKEFDLIPPDGVELSLSS
jgi:hypothetical protein